VRQHGGDPSVQAQVKTIWDKLAEEFLNLKFVRAHDNKWNPFDSVDGLEMVLKFTKLASFESINDLITWVQKKVWNDELSFARYAIGEAAFTSRRADFIIYGHTHHHEIVPLDTYSVGDRLAYQIMVNTGTWRTYYDLTRYRPEEQKFIPYQLMTYLAFYKDDERRATATGLVGEIGLGRGSGTAKPACAGRFRSNVSMFRCADLRWYTHSPSC
jgi:hypothetical protein